MSLKIPNGYKYHGDLASLFVHLGTLRQMYRPRVQKMYREDITKNLHNKEYCDMTRVEFRQLLGIPFENFSNLQWAVYYKAWILTGSTYHLNTSAHVMVYPNLDGILVEPKINFVLDNLHDLSPDFEYYGYWDDSDRDEECSADEWNERENVWNSIIHNVGSSQKRDLGLVFEVFGLHNVEDIINTINIEAIKEGISHRNTTRAYQTS